MIITGKTLIEWGYKPNKWFKEALEYLNTYPLTREEAELYLKKFDIKEVVPFEQPVFYHQNIRCENLDEEANLKAVKKSMESLMLTPTILTGAIMPDSCPTGEGQIPVGGIVVTHNAIHPSMHSSDVCCSVMTTDLGKVDPKTVLDIAMKTTQFGPGGRKEHGGWESILWDNKALTDRILDNYYTKDYVVKAAKHLGTQGDGNHFLFVGVSEKTGNTHIVTHHGSRGFGASVYKKGLHTAIQQTKQLSPQTPKNNSWIVADSHEGKLYWEALQIVREWTKLNHECIHNRILDKLKVGYLNRFWNEHNFVFRDGDKYYHAKGATPLDDKFVPDSQEGLRLIPMNMSQPVLIIKGETTETNLGFAPHGAGRNFSRGQHKQRNSKKTPEQLFKEETKDLDIRFYSGKIDISELPSAYKNAESVQKQMEEFGLGTVVDRIMPYGCIMAGEFEKRY